jgi:hypothetical protein
MPALDRQGFRKLSADLIDQAIDKTDEQVVRLMWLSMCRPIRLPP